MSIQSFVVEPFVERGLRDARLNWDGYEWQASEAFLSREFFLFLPFSRVLPENFLLTMCTRQLSGGDGRRRSQRLLHLGVGEPLFFASALNVFRKFSPADRTYYNFQPAAFASSQKGTATLVQPRLSQRRPRTVFYSRFIYAWNGKHSSR